MRALYHFLPAIVTILMAGTPALAVEGMNLPADISYEATGKSVLFSHKAHVDDFGLACDDCHGKIFEPRAYAAKENGDFNMNGLYAGKYCGACHNGEKAFASDDFESCERCHTGNRPEFSNGKPTGPSAPIKLGSDENMAEFKHPAHAGFKCYECHTALFPMKDTKTITTMDDINAGKACGTCHNGKKAFDASQCGTCHPKM
jgi:c(7)-type cytochrome triheme protein